MHMPVQFDSCAGDHANFMCARIISVLIRLPGKFLLTSLQLYCLRCAKVCCLPYGAMFA